MNNPKSVTLSEALKSNTKFKYLVYAGRFEPFHRGHLETIKQALNIAEKVIVLCGSIKRARNTRNPFTFYEREFMIRHSCEDAGIYQNGSIIITGVRDRRYNDQQWVRDVQREIGMVIANDPGDVGIIGHSKDETSYYLKMFPQWLHIEMPNFEGINSTDIRTALFGDGSIPLPLLTDTVSLDLSGFLHTPDYKQLVQEYQYEWSIKERKQLDFHPETRNDCAADAIVIQSGHILLVKRRSIPGKGLWALPGGYKNINETFRDCAIRELYEETRIDIPEKVLRGSEVKWQLFDDPKRSNRGTIISSGFLFELAPGKLPKVKGTDDAAKAKWWPIGQLEEIEDQLFEDHADIINYFLGVL